MLTCPHVNAEADSHYAWFLGQGIDRFLVCPTCAAAYPTPPRALSEASSELLESLEHPFSCLGVVGAPGIRSRESTLHFLHEGFRSPSGLNDRVLVVIPDNNSQGDWYCLTASGEFHRMNIRGQTAERLFCWSDFGFELDDETELCCASKSDFGAVYEASGQFGFVFDMRTGEIAMRLDRKDYRPENSRYPLAFFVAENRTLLVTATDWNRLDIIDPSTMDVLTKRTHPASNPGETLPEHYLDYFHSQLLVSPKNNWIVDNGWVWHPVGVIRSWNLLDWLTRNPWESEDGPSVRSLASRLYFWDGPICWIDNTTVAIWGWGTDDEWLVPAVRLVDVVSGRELKWFAGPMAGPGSAWPPKNSPPSLIFDEYLFSINKGTGTSVWDIGTDERVHCDSSFAPIQFHRRSKEFLSLTENGFQLSRFIH